MQIAPWLLATPGASRVVMDVQFPYSRKSLIELLGTEPSQYCSMDVARDLATAAFERACTLYEDEDSEAERSSGSTFESSCPKTVGVGCTASLRSEPMKRGEHRCFLAVRTASGMHEISLTLAKGARSREVEDAVVSRLALLSLAHVCKVDDAPAPGDDPEADKFWQLVDDQLAQASSSSDFDCSEDCLEVAYRAL